LDFLLVTKKSKWKPCGQNLYNFQRYDLICDWLLQIVKMENMPEKKIFKIFSIINKTLIWGFYWSLNKV